MLYSSTGFTVLKPIYNKRGIPEEKTNKGEVISSEIKLTKGIIVYFIPHSAMEITAEDGIKYIVVPNEDICAIEPLEPLPNNQTLGQE